jgi:ABC-type dipeptide/oligopeptide/nickel transport system permease subunit
VAEPERIFSFELVDPNRLLGLAAGLRGGWVDFTVMRAVEVMVAFPGILFAMFLVTVMGGGMRNIIIAIGVTSWVTICRLTRSQLLMLREQEFVQAARALGAGKLLRRRCQQARTPAPSPSSP